MKRIFLFISLILVASVTVCAQSQDRWTILQDGSIVDVQQRFHLNRSLVFPMLRMKPNKTQNNLKQRFDVNIPAMVTVDDQTLLNEVVQDITFNGIMRVESDYGYIYRRKELKNAIHVTRILYPSINAPRYLEEYTFKNNSQQLRKREVFMLLIVLKLLYPKKVLLF